MTAAQRYTLGGLLAFGALNAFAGGFYGMSGAEGVPIEWLANSPFTTYFVPSLILFLVVGGSLLTAATAVFWRWRRARVMAIGAAAVVLGWLAVQLSIIGYVSWMQPATAIGAVVVLALAWRSAAQCAEGCSIKEAAAHCLAERRIAVTGVSRKPQGHGSNIVYQRLRQRGYLVFPVNPNAEQVEGDRCYRDLRSIPGGVTTRGRSTSDRRSFWKNGLHS